VTSRTFATAVALLAAALLSACAGARELRADRISIVAPAQLARVELPATVRWRTEGLPESVTRFAVFVDRGDRLDRVGHRSNLNVDCAEKPPTRRPCRSSATTTARGTGRAVCDPTPLASGTAGTTTDDRSVT